VGVNAAPDGERFGVHHAPHRRTSRRACPLEPLPPTQATGRAVCPWPRPCMTVWRTARSSATARLADLEEACAAGWPAALPAGSACCGAPEPARPPPRLGRRLPLEPGRPVWPSAPAGVRPAMPGRPHAVDAAWGWRRWQGPCGAMTPVWGREALAGERLGHGLGRCRRVGPPVTRPAPGPQALGAEAKPRGWQGARVDSAPTAAPACRVGASGAPSASPGDGDQASAAVGGSGLVAGPLLPRQARLGGAPRAGLR
jgi:hypothetical protein